jgi:hypothetical protein
MTELEKVELTDGQAGTIQCRADTRDLTRPFMGLRKWDLCEVYRSRRGATRMKKCILATGAIALLIFGSSANAEPDFDARSICQDQMKALSQRGSPCRLRDLRDGWCHAFPDIVEQLNKLMIKRDSLLLAWQDCPGGLAGEHR